MLQSAGLAIRALTNSAPQTQESSTEGREEGQGEKEGEALEAHKRAFKDSSAKYFALLSSIDVRLRRQVYALEEAGVIEPEASAESVGAAGGVATATSGGAGGGTATNPLEISWLNSRKDTVGKDKEAELWAGARKLVSRHTEDGNDSSGAEGRGHMEVD